MYEGLDYVFHLTGLQEFVGSHCIYYSVFVFGDEPHGVEFGQEGIAYAVVQKSGEVAFAPFAVACTLFRRGLAALALFKC